MANAATYIWIGASGGSWTSSSNWFPSIGYPGSSGTTDDAYILSSSVTISYTGTHTIGTLNTVGYGIHDVIIQFTGTTPVLNVTSGMSIDQPVNNQTGITFSGAGTVSIAGATSFSYQAGFAIAANAVVTFPSGSTIDLTNANGTLINAGTINCNNCTLSSTGKINNSGTVNMTAGGLFSFSGSPTASVVTNTGNFNITSSTITFGNNNNGFQNSGAGVLTTSSATINLSGAAAFLSNSGTIKATNTAFNFGNGNTISNSSSFTTQATCKFNLTTSGSSFSNTGTFTDHGSTFSFTGQSAKISNSSAATMTLRGTTITMSGANNGHLITNSGSLTADSASSINMGTFNGKISNTGTMLAGTSNSPCIITLSGQGTTVSNTNIFKLGSTSIIYPSGLSANITNTSPGVFTLQSDANGSAAIGPLNTTAGNLASATGTFNVERYFQGSLTFDAVKNKYAERGYRIISSPVNTGTASGGNKIVSFSYIAGTTAGHTLDANSSTNAFVTGAVGGSTSAGNPTLYLYRENKAPSNTTFTSGNWIGITNITDPTKLTTTDGANFTVPVGNGVFFFFRGAATNWTTRTQQFPYLPPESVTLTSTGTLNQGSITVKDWYTPSSSNLGMTSTTGNDAIRGFNMVGNPYASTIDWANVSTGGIVATQIDPTIYVFNPVTYQYESYSYSNHTGNPATRTGKIVSGQGFFVKVLPTATAPVLTFNETAKAPTSQLTNGDLLMGTPAKQAKIQLLRLKMVADSLNYDDIVIGFSASATEKYDGYEDSRDLGGMGALEGLTAYSSDGVPLAADLVPLPKIKPLTIQLGVSSAQTRRYTMQRPMLDSIPKIYEIWLMDKFKKDSLDLRHNNSYVFDVNLADTTSYGKNRFTVVVRQNKALGIHLLSFTATKATAGSQIEWKTENEEAYTNFTVERSTDNGVTFDIVGGFASNGQGIYTLLDKNPVNNAANIYRLKIEDLNGTISYSKTVSLIYGTGSSAVAANTINVYPNPAVSTINLAIRTNAPVNLISGVQSVGAAKQVSNQSYAIKIVNVSGNVVKTAVSSQPTWQDDVATLLPGTYIIQVINNADKSVVGRTTFIKI